MGGSLIWPYETLTVELTETHNYFTFFGSNFPKRNLVFRSNCLGLLFEINYRKIRLPFLGLLFEINYRKIIFRFKNEEEHFSF